MTYESTGEVRNVEPGEFFLTNSGPGGSGYDHKVKRYEGPKVDDLIRVIMRPVEEPREITSWECAVGNFSSEDFATMMKEWLETQGYSHVEVRPVYGV